MSPSDLADADGSAYMKFLMAPGLGWLMTILELSFLNFKMTDAITPVGPVQSDTRSFSDSQRKSTVGGPGRR